MKQQQTEVQKTEQVPEITFEELCAPWDKTINQEGGFSKIDVNKNYGKVQNQNIADYGCCIVGSAFSLE